MPAEPHPFFFDAATSCVAQGKVELYAKRNEPLPATWVVDRQYRTVTDAEAAVPKLDAKTGEFALVPLGGVSEYTGGHKGYGFSMVVELLTGILAQGHLSHESKESDINTALCHNFIAVDPALFGDREAIYQRFSQFLDEVRALPPVEGHRVYVHGDKEAIAREERTAHGIPLYPQTEDEIHEIMRRLGLDTAQFAPLV
ncbi:malate dehydrogenase [Bifidobacterium sp. DSM 109959]|uniref:Malate dehydrogenase n=1 Tax=Bifidobacterium olomucense TaxID=2675324 RepID=A0A7Y0EYB5_9BIFI|nr:malate dehydrogenase [Bifidobacterium sp. DSM 109959]